MRSTNTARAIAALVVTGCWAAVPVAWAEPAPPSPSPPAPSPGPPPAPRTVIDKDGTYAVGTDIVPGIYRTDGPVEGKVCYWKRVKDDQILDNALTKKPQVVQIEPTDTAFKTDRCQPWQKTECPPDCLTTQPRPDVPPEFKNFMPPAPPAPQAPPAPPAPPAPQAPAPGGR